MIRRVDIPNSIEAGKTIKFSVHADGPLVIQIGCFVDRPPPPRFTGCPECEVLHVQSEESILFTAGVETWRGKRGFYQFTITDATGDSRQVSMGIIQRGEGESGGQAESGGAAFA